MKHDVPVLARVLFLIAVTALDLGYAAVPTVSSINGSLQVAVTPNSFTLSFTVTPPVPPENISWFLGASIDITNTPGISNDRLSLTFFPVIASNEGMYRLEATNTDGTGSGTARVDVQSEPGFLTLPEDQKIHERENVTFQCFATADPTPDVNWFFRDQRIDPEGSNKYFIGPFGDINYGSLTIFNLEFADAGDYTCVFNNTHASASAVATLEVQVFPVIVMQPVSANKTAGGVDSISCTARGFPFTDIYWQKNGQNITDIQGSEIASYSQTVSSPDMIELTVVGTLTITGPVLSTGGNFSCTATNFLVTFEKAVSDVVDIFVQYPPSTEAVSMVTVNQSDPASFNCSSFGIPPPTLAWYSSLNPETPVLSMGVVSVEFSSFVNGSDLQIQTSILSISSTNRTLHEATYTCLAVNGIENLIGTPEQATTELLVQVPPSLRSPPGNILLGIVTETITLTLVIDNASPAVRPSNVIWQFTPFSSNTLETLEAGSQYSFSLDRLRLTISYLTHDNEGNYVVMATNEAGSDSFQLTLNIEAAPNITIFPVDTDVLLNYNTSLMCGATSEPPHAVQWLKGDTVLTDTVNKFSITQMEGELERENVSTLTVLYAEMNDTADYTCIVSNIHGAQNHTAHLEVQVPPVILNDRDNTTNTIIGIVGESTSISCQFFGSPIPDVVWFKDSQLLNLPNANLSVVMNEEGFTRNSTLVFSSLDFSDDGEYVCQGRNTLVNLQTTNSSNIILVINHPPRVISIEGLRTVNETQTANITCVFLARPTPVITWTRGDVFSPITQIEDDSKYNIITEDMTQTDGISVLTTSLLQITNVNGNDGSVYTCTATNKARGPSTPDETASDSLNIIVQTSPIVMRVSDEIEIGVKGRSIGLTIDISGAIPIVLRNVGAIWYLRRGNGQPEQQIVADARHTFSPNRELLTITDLVLEDQGTYSLNASNIIGRDSDTIFLDVQRSPMITNNSGVVMQVLGRNALFECTAVSEPIHISRWLFGEVELSNPEKYLVQGNGTTSSNLTVFNVSLADEGNYTCRVDNAHGADEESAQLVVQVPPTITMEPEDFTVLVTGTASLTCCASGIPTPIISWFNESERVQNSLKTMISQTGQCGTLAITNAILSDTAQYSCEANNTLAEELSKMSGPASVIVQYPPEVFPLTQTNYTRNESDEFIVECNAFGVPLPMIYWVPGPLRETLATPEDQLLSAAEVKAYLSSIVNFSGSRLLNAQSQCLVEQQPPPNPPDACVYETNASSDCSLTGSLCSVPCGVEIITSSGGTDSMGRDIVTSRLRICSLLKSDELSYTCVAVNNISNVIGTAEGAFTNLIVQVPPEVVSIEEVDPVTAFRDRTVILNFTINRASPEVDPADIVWTFQGQQLNAETVTLDTSNPHYQFLDGSRSLRILDLLRNDTGTYTLIAQNPAGIRSGVINLNVQALPDIENFPTGPLNETNNDTICLECFADGFPIQNVSWTLTNVSGVEVYSIRYVIDNLTNQSGHIEYLPNVEGISVDFLRETFKIAPPSRSSMTYGQLTINKITPFEAGTYDCTLENEFGMDSRGVRVQVQLSPDIIQPPVDTTCVQGTRCQLTCLVQGVPSPDITFWKVDVLVKEGGEIELITTVNNYTHRGVALTFMNTILSDVGTYSCRANNDLVELSMDESDNIILTVHSPASISSSLSNTVGNESFGASFACSVSGIPKPDITWSRIESRLEVPINSDSDKFEISSYNSTGDFGLITVTSTLMISDLNISDELTYRCAGQNGVDNAIGAISVSLANLTVQVPPSVTPVNPDSIVTNGTETVIVFDITRARPSVQLTGITWNFQHVGADSNMTLDPSCTLPGANCSDLRYSRYNFSSDLQTLTIYSVRVADYGLFSLTASNPAGYSTETVNITINVRPRLRSVSGRRIQLNESDTLILNCTADGLPRPTFTWTFNSVPIGLRPRTRQVQMEERAFRESINTVPPFMHGITSILNITSVLRATDQGIYSCVADNILTAQSQQRVQLEVAYDVTITEVFEDFCASTPCLHGGTCNNRMERFICTCGEEDGIRYDGPTCNEIIIIPIPPTITEQPESQSVNLFGSVVLNCLADGQPTPTIRWMKGDTLLSVVGSPYEIPEVNLGDRGFYICTATNTEGSVSSREALVNIENVAQYVANLIVRFDQIFSNNLTAAANGIIQEINVRASTLIAARGDTFFRISSQGNPINNTKNITVPIIVTILIGSGVADETLRQSVEIAVADFGFQLQISDQTEVGVARFNRCPPEPTMLPSPDGNPELTIILNWPETFIGTTERISCPCNLTLGSAVLTATRTCGGNFQTGAVWNNPLDSNCDFSVTARELCRLANLNNDGDILSSLSSVTSNTNALGSTELTITTSLLERTQPGASRNNTLIQSAADTFDNTLRANRSSQLEGQINARSQGRALEVFMNLTSSINVTENGQEMIIRDTFVTLADMVPSTRSNIDTSDIGPGILPVSIQADFSELTNDGSPLARTVSAFQNDGLYLERDPGQRTVITTVVDYTLVNMEVSNLNSTINSTYTLNNDTMIDDVGTVLLCVFWNETLDNGFGAWSSDGCELDGDRSSGQITCRCNHLTGFSILLDVAADQTPPPEEDLAFTTLTYIGISISIVCIIVTIFTYLYSKKLRKSEANQLLVNLCFALLGLYLTFFVASQGSKITTVVCGIVGALLHYFLLVVFFIMAAEAVDLFIKLVIVLGSKIQHYIKKTTIIAWFLPLFIIPFTISPKYNEYVNPHFCGATGPALYVGVLIPFFVVYIFNNTIFFIIMCSLVKKSGAKRFSDAKKKSIKQETKQHCRVAFTISMLFGLGWGFGILASQAISIQGVRVIFNTLFTIFTAFQGFFIFLLYILMSPNARKEWKRWLLRKEEKGKGEHTSSAASSKSTASTGVKKYSAASYSMYNKKRGGTLYHNVYSSKPSTTTKSGYTDEFTSGVFDSEQPMLEEMKRELGDQILPNPLEDYEDTFSMLSEPDTQSIGETTYAFPNPKPPLSLEEGVEVETSQTLEDVPVECTTLDNPFLSVKGKQISVDGDDIELLSQDNSTGNHAFGLDLSESFSQSLGFSQATFSDDKNLIKPPRDSNY